MCGALTLALWTPCIFPILSWAWRVHGPRIYWNSPTNCFANPDDGCWSCCCSDKDGCLCSGKHSCCCSGDTVHIASSTSENACTRGCCCGASLDYESYWESDTPCGICDGTLTLNTRQNVCGCVCACCCP